MMEGGRNIDQIIQYLIDHDTNRYGTPPAKKSAIESLPKGGFKDLLTSSEIAKEHPSCSVCVEKFDEKETELIKMPCSHLFHKDCLMPWLE